MKIYTCKAVDEVTELYGHLLRLPNQSMPIHDHLELLAFRLWNAYQEKNRVVRYEISNYHPDFLGKQWEEIQRSNFSLEDAYHTIAQEYGFKNWLDVKTYGQQPYDLAFESAVDSLLTGQLSDLKTLLNSNHQLIQQTSPYGHQATLLHYVGSNGFELWRQKVPMNLPEITKYLIEKGANKKAQMAVYGGFFSPLELLSTSAHPTNAGIMKFMKEILV